ncbi:hypothetical protein O3Q52_20045 [Streptomyces sp. ActVer]|uniref:hypothetical protein n=1 Tax=Streptomyces sp. ActVer TaxID=3014558 RepID=UPI0022B2FFB0|nr:hypothetical protein [Streptomyces sp. ActVer]MCZ4510439.1 hypothetical protein [Streptomyces sp. ActVer]
MPDNECQLCGAPGGYPYCNEACREADQDEAEGEVPAISAADFGALTDITDLGATDARNHR